MVVIKKEAQSTMKYIKKSQKHSAWEIRFAIPIDLIEAASYQRGINK